jgi:hypothetical protein
MEGNMSGSVAEIGKKKRRPRSPSIARPAFVVVQVLDEDGNPEAFDKKRLRIVCVERNAEKVMEMMEDGTHPSAFYLRVTVPVAARQGARKEQAAA